MTASRAHARRRERTREKISPRRKPSSRLRPLRVHIENDRKLPSVFVVTPERYEAALKRHPDVAPYLETTIGFDFEIYEKAMTTAEVLIGYRFPKESLRKDAPQLRWIQVLGAGVDYLLPLDWLPPDITVTTNSGAHPPKAAESASMAILMMNARIPFLLGSQRRHEWTRQFTPRVAGRVLGIVGVGRIGGAIAREAKRLGMHVLGVRRSRRPHRFVDEMFGPDGLDEVLARADILLANLALTSATRKLFGSRQFALMKPTASFINMTRGGVVDQEALADALRNGRLSGALIDVTSPEPLPSDSPLWDVPNLIITPHVLSDDDDEYVPRTLDIFMDNVRRYCAGQPLRNRVDTEREY
jgi:phosphoglycerate dehydrogenase-like enzyme